MYNRIILVGRLTRDPELRYTPNGSAVASFRLAVNDRWRDKEGQQREETLYIDVTVWGNQGEVASRYLSRGRPVLVDGRLRMETWQDRDGNKRITYRVVANRVVFLGVPATQGEPTSSETPEVAEPSGSFDVPPPVPDLDAEEPPF